MKNLFLYNSIKGGSDNLNLARGQSLMEILIAIAVGVIMIGAAAIVIVPALKINTDMTFNIVFITHLTQLT